MRPIPATLWLALMVAPAAAQEIHRHGNEVITGEVGRFYETWRKPDKPNESCCNRLDCYATEARFVNDRWQAKRREDGKWLNIPEQKIERNRDMPDSRAHLCAPPPNHPHYEKDAVFCFGAGSGS